MTTAEQLLLKLQTGHGPFKQHRINGKLNTWKRHDDANHGDPVLICVCHGWAFDNEKLVRNDGDWRERVK